jgi:hypothetical protein
MLPDAQLLTISTSFANYNLGGLSSTAKSVLASSFVFVRTSHNSTEEEEEEQESMAHHHRHARGDSQATEHELWFNMPSTLGRQQEDSRASEPSAYRATNHRLSTGSTSLGVPIVVGGIPSISTTADTNKPLPPSPTESERKKRRPTYLRSLLGRPSSSHLDPTHLQPQPYYSNHRYSATSTSLSLETNGPHHHTYSRSMPSSPYEYDHTTTSPHPVTNPRANLTTTNYVDSTQYRPYTPPLQEHSDAAYIPRQQRSPSVNTYFETTPPRALTFPTDTSVASPTMREGVTNRPRPHTWLSPTESFSDASQFSLFVQATTGLPEDSDPFSPNGPPQLQGSLFARRSGNDIIPLPFQNAAAAASGDTNWRTDWQNFEPPAIPDHSILAAAAPSLSRSIPYQSTQQTIQMAAINRELEILGLDDDNGPDDELPDYAQSQAEAHARSRAEASARAMELEARWRSTRRG